MAYTTINKSGDYFNTKLYTGNGSTNHSITGVGFQPDWTWIKSRDDAYNHFVFDAVRGAGKQIHPDLTNAESTNLNNLYSFDSDGFSLAQSGNDDVTNKNNSNFASWNWKANGTGSANTDGSISSTVSANTTSGFSIVSYTGTGANATIGHGLGVVPKMVIVKRLSNTENWTVYHNSIGNTKYLNLDDTATATTYNMWQNTTPTSSVFSITTHNRLNANGDDYIAYCFAEKTGYSKIGSYEANNNNDGTFVYTGFKPAFILMKSADVSGREWFLIDNKRSASGGSNVNSTNLVASTNSAEWNNDGWGAMDLLSNGFKIRTNDANKNSSGTYIYLAIGQSLVGSNNVPCTAR